MEIAIQQEVTGTLPIEGLLHHGPLRQLPWAVARLLWEGCLDAPEHIVAGGIRRVVVEGEFIGQVARAVMRD